MNYEMNFESDSILAKRSGFRGICNECLESLRNSSFTELFIVPSCILSILSFLVLLSNIGSGYFYESNINHFSASLFIASLLFISIYLLTKNRYPIIHIFVGVFLGIYYAKRIWFSGYLNLDPIATFLSGNTHIDTLFHTDIAESFINNGYPSIQFNDSSFLHYHFFSHFLFSLISRLLNIPAIITYNYVYPVLFIPLYVFSLELVVDSFRKRFNVDKSSKLLDIAFLLCICTGFNFFDFSDKGSIGYNSIIISESFLVGMILILLTASIIFTNNNNITNFLIVIPLAIFIVSASKISCGLIFVISVCYYLFRSNIKSVFNWILILLYSVIFFIFYFLFYHSFSSGEGNFYILHYLRTYVKYKYWILHFIIYLLPCICLLKFGTNGAFFSTEYLKSKENIWAEMSVIITFISLLPELLIKIAGGSALYFSLPAFIISALLLQGLNVHCKIYDMIKKNGNPFFILLPCILIIAIQQINLLYIFVCIIILFWVFKANPKQHKYDLMKCSLIFLIIVSLLFPELKKSEISRTVYTALTLSNKKSLETIKSHKDQLKQCFNDSDYLLDGRYVSISEIRKLINKNRSDYCLFLADDCYVYELYGKHNFNPAYVMKGDFAAASLYGIPVINAIYKNDKYGFRGDDKLAFEVPFDDGYGLLSVHNKQKVTQENMIAVAKEYKKKYIILLTNDTYRVIDVGGR